MYSGMKVQIGQKSSTLQDDEITIMCKLQMGTYVSKYQHFTHANFTSNWLNLFSFSHDWYPAIHTISLQVISKLCIIFADDLK